MKDLIFYILLFLIVYFLILLAVEPFIVKSNLKALQKAFVVVGFSAIPFLIIVMFTLSIIH
jgi:hypothetical protein